MDKSKRKMRIAKVILTAVSEYFCNSELNGRVVILNVHMLNKNNAHILYAVTGLSVTTDEVTTIHEHMQLHLSPARKYIAKAAALRYTPVIHFKFDPSTLDLT